MGEPKTELLHDDRGWMCVVQPQKEISRRTIEESIIQSIGIGLLVVAVIVPVLYLVFQQGSLWIAIPATVVAAVACLILAERWIAGRRRGLLQRKLLADRCPACDFDLSAALPVTDGCTLCPECGAAWRLPARAPDA